jgi:hypothetical protein
LARISRSLIFDTTLSIDLDEKKQLNQTLVQMDRDNGNAALWFAAQLLNLGEVYGKTT